MYKISIEIYYTGNLIGRTIFLTSENYRMANHRPQTKIFTSEKNHIGFPTFHCPLSSRKTKRHGVVFGHFKARRYSISRRNQRKRKSKHQKENWAEYCSAEGICDVKRRVESWRRNSPKRTELIHQQIHWWERNKTTTENELFNAWLIASFERYLKRKKFGYSFMNEVEFEKVQMGFKSKEKVKRGKVNKRFHFTWAL